MPSQTQIKAGWRQLRNLRPAEACIVVDDESSGASGVSATACSTAAARGSQSSGGGRARGAARLLLRADLEPLSQSCVAVVRLIALDEVCSFAGYGGVLLVRAALGT